MSESDSSVNMMWCLYFIFKSNYEIICDSCDENERKKCKEFMREFLSEENMIPMFDYLLNGTCEYINNSIALYCMSWMALGNGADISILEKIDYSIVTDMIKANDNTITPRAIFFVCNYMASSTLVLNNFIEKGIFGAITLILHDGTIPNKISACTAICCAINESTVYLIEKFMNEDLLEDLVELLSASIDLDIKKDILDSLKILLVKYPKSSFILNSKTQIHDILDDFFNSLECDNNDSAFRYDFYCAVKSFSNELIDAVEEESE